MAEENSGVSGIPDFITQVKARSNGSDLMQRLTDIEWVERVLVAANNILGIRI